ncbi:hypothetical protein GGX14DRAFT_396262 [Mycena pura]|uniref:Uncharacterized protein n=1 Tax=Mycena pura TaxID=153505 RepID=A0AAD6VCI4_9AGAR|nr:hypothetical protein GGX14DRAFT_396262 [Mycena pura]
MCQELSLCLGWSLVHAVAGGAYLHTFPSFHVRGSWLHQALRAAPLSEAAVFALCSALVVLQAVAATLLRRVDAALAGVAAGDASSGSARRAACALAGGAAGLVMASYRKLEHRERESDAAGPGFAHKQ